MFKREGNMDLDPRVHRGAFARRFSWLIFVAAGWVLSAPACSPSNDTVTVTGNGGSGGTVDAGSGTSTGGTVATGGNAGAPRGGGGGVGTGGSVGTGGTSTPPEAGSGDATSIDAASDVVVYV